MKAHVRVSVVVLLLLCCCCLQGIQFAVAEASAGRPSAASASQAHDPESSTGMMIPGPLRSFLRMAAISQKAPPEEVLPLLARNAVIQGYSWQGRSGRPTEYLILLQRYVRQARELLALAAADGTIHVADCNSSTLQPLLTALGYTLRAGCGPETALETADPQRAFLTIDSGFPLTDLEEALRGGKPFAYPFSASQVPVLFSVKDWTEINPDHSSDLLDSLLAHPDVARLYWALSRMEGHTRTLLEQSEGLEKLLPFAGILDFYGGYLYVRSGRVVVPGGTAAEAAWKNLVGANPGSPAEFVSRLLSKDDGWLAAYFDALSRISATQQAYFVEPRRLQRFYEALLGRDASPGPTRSVFRPDPGLLLLAARLQLDPSGQPHVPGNLDVWKQILGQKTESKVVRELGKRANRWSSPDDMVEGLFALSRADSGSGPLEIYFALSAIDRKRAPDERLSPQTALLLARDFFEYGDQYRIFSEFYGLNDTSIAGFLNVAAHLSRISDWALRSDALGLFQANVGLWQILARQGEIPVVKWNASWQSVTGPFAGVTAAPQLFDVARASFGSLVSAAAGRQNLSEDELIELLAGPEQSSAEGQRVRENLASRIHSVLDAQRLVSLDTIFSLRDGLDQIARGEADAREFAARAGELHEFGMPKPIFTEQERIEWAGNARKDVHTQAELQTDWAKTLRTSGSHGDLSAARGKLAPFFRDTLVGLNYAYYQPPGAQVVYTNPLFVRSHDFSGQTILNEQRSWKTPDMFGRGFTASGGVHLIGSLADLPYVLSQVEENFIVPRNVQSLIWEDLTPSLLIDSVLPRWWRVTPNEMHAAALYQRSGEELVTAAAKNETLRQPVMSILSDRMIPGRLGRVEDALAEGQPDKALAQLSPADSYYLALEFRQRSRGGNDALGEASQELDELARRDPEAIRPERLSQDFGGPHPALEQTYAVELVDLKPFPTLQGYSSRLLAETWDSNNLYWARLADEMGYSPVMLHVLVPELTRRMVQNIFATHLEDWPALLRALRQTGEEFRSGKMNLGIKPGVASGLGEIGSEESR
jgi:hypothetical protein